MREKLDPYAQEAPHGHEAMLSKSEFVSIIKGRQGSACGPDGFPYS